MKYNNTKLICFLRTYTKAELNEFEKYLSSPYFKTGRDLISVYKALISFHPDYTSESLNEEYIFKILFPSSDFSEKKSLDIIKTL